MRWDLGSWVGNILRWGEDLVDFIPFHIHTYIYTYIYIYYIGCSSKLRNGSGCFPLFQHRVSKLKAHLRKKTPLPEILRDGCGSNSPRFFC